MSNSTTHGTNTTTTNNSYNITDRVVVGKSNNSNGSAASACAACKYQRRKCAPDCILAPYFPHDRHRQFLNAHKLFGVRKITRIIENLSTRAEKDEAMRAIIIQSDVRASDPVGGCYRILRDLQRQVQYGEAQLDLLLHHLAIFRQQQQQQTSIDSDIDHSEVIGCLDVYSDPMLLQFHCPGQQQQQQSDQREDREQQQLLLNLMRGLEF